jgi:hypothetical protein
VCDCSEGKGNYENQEPRQKLGVGDRWQHHDRACMHAYALSRTVYQTTLTGREIDVKFTAAVTGAVLSETRRSS